MTGAAPDWVAITRRNARSVQTTIGWIYFDPGATARYEAIGLPGPLGYIAGRCAPLAGAGPQAVTAAFGSISPIGIQLTFLQLDPDLTGDVSGFLACWAARDEAVLEGLAAFAPDIRAPLAELGPALWTVVDQLPLVGRVFFGAHLAMPRPDDPVLSGWHAVNCLREWRGDTHWALVVAAGLTHPEASILHNAWVGYDGDWLAESRGTTPEDIEAGWAALEGRGLARDRQVTEAGIALRQQIEDDTDERTTLPWRLLGEADARAFADRFEPPCELLLARVDETAGVRYQPASRIRPPR
jgi:hypothetical protein